MIKLRPGIVWCVASTCAGGELVTHEKSNVPPHTHQESQSPQGPNTYSLSFAQHGGNTTTVVVTVVRAGSGK
jgi:hypothetical protein